MRSSFDSVENLLQLAEALLQRREVPDAIAAFDRAEAAGAAADRCAGSRWIAHMLAGDFAAAWGESDAIRGRGAADPHRFWQGEDVRGKRLILRCLHGYGDAVQFLRYAPWLRELTSRLVVEVPPAMAEIASCFAGIDQVVTWGSGAPVPPPEWDLQVEVMELPYLFRTQPGELPIAQAYLHLPDNVRRQAAQAIVSSTVPRVGLVWAAGEWNAARSLPMLLLQPLLRDSACEFWSLQGGGARWEWRASGSFHVRDAACCGEGILPLAAAIAQMDLVITVDTLAAHLAGALSKPAWVLLQHAADWRWMIGCSHSLWYPSLRLFRQPTPGDWESTLTSVRQELASWAAEKAA